MMSVVLLGSSGSGKTVFLTLLYETMIRFSNSSSSEKTGFRVMADPHCARALGDLRMSLSMGEWPNQSRLAEGLDSCTLSYGKKRFLSKKHNILDLTFYDVPGTVVAPDLDFEGRPRATKTVESILGSSDGILAVIDISAESQEAVPGSADMPASPDQTTADMLRACLDMAAFDASRSDSHRAPFVAYVLSKFDLVSENALRKMGMPKKPPRLLDEKMTISASALAERRKYASRILKSLLPETRDALREIETKNPSLEQRMFFFCGLETDRVKTGGRIPRVRSAESSPSLNYTYEEYVAVIEYLWNEALKTEGAISVQ